MAGQEQECRSAGAFRQPADFSSSLEYSHRVGLVQLSLECGGRYVATDCVCLRLLSPYIRRDQWFWLIVRPNSLQCECAGDFHTEDSQGALNKFCVKSCS